ncbi:MAG: alpha/beta hydrolase family protein [Solirubrobacterales bacterium]|nr:alpha/beta hydrolase family protein [Solirubrobacterales bacterium]
MPLDPQAKELIALLDAGFPKLGEDVTDAAEARAILAAQPAPPLDPPPIGHVEDRTVPGADGEVGARAYWPVGRDGPEGEALPLIVFFHGGGFVLCDLDTHDVVCRNLANMADAVVLSIDYRLSPETPYPGGLEDCYAATVWAHEHAAELGGDPTRLVVAGDSSGGNFAAVVAMMARDRGGPPISYQYLIYPVTDQDFESGSYRENGGDYFTTATHMRWYCEQYGGAADDPYVAPLRAQDLSGLPPARIITAEYDPLRDEGEAYAKRLQEAGVDATVRRFDGMFHGFFTFSLIFPPGQTANEEEFAALRERLHAS